MSLTKDISVNKSIRILVVDDEQSLRDVVSQVLLEDGYDVTTVDSGEKAVAVSRKRPFHIVVTDIRMNGMDGIKALQEIKKINQHTQVIIMTSHASLDTAITALREGAYDYLIKPFEDLEIISQIVGRASEKLRLSIENRRLILELKHKNQELIIANKKLNELAIRDGLTGLHNHRYFQEILAQEIQQFNNPVRCFSIVFLDVDFFKKYNDAHGHLEGDYLLRKLGKIVVSSIRYTDLAARYGGEEFIVLLPETGKENAYKVAESIRHSVEEYPFKHRETQPGGRVTVSIGVSTFPDDGTDAKTLVRVADESLYYAKRHGRNAIHFNGIDLREESVAE